MSGMPPPSPFIRRCQNCGKEVTNIKYLYCPICGFKLEIAAKTTKAQAVDETLQTWKAMKERRYIHYVKKGQSPLSLNEQESKASIRVVEKTIIDVCSFCGSQIELQHKFCPVCGKRRSSAYISNRIPTGIIGEPSLDYLLEGGFEQGKTYLVAGETGTGKTIFSLQYLIDGIKRNEPGLYVTFDERPERLVQDTERFGWMLEHYVRDHKLLILPVRQYFTTKMWYTDMNKIMNVIIYELKRRSRQVNARRLVIDPIEPLIPMNTNELTWVRDYIKKLVLSIERELETTNIITSRLPVSDTRSGMELFPTSGIIVLELSRVGNQFLRTFCIREMKWTNLQPTVCRFEIEKNRGIVLKGTLSKESEPTPPPSEHIPPSIQVKYKSQFNCKACGHSFWVSEHRLKVPYCQNCGAPDPIHIETVEQ